MATSFRRWVVAFLFLLVLGLASACGGGEESPFNVKSEVVVRADHPMAMAFAPDGRLFYGEQITGNIRVVNADGKLQEEPFAHVEAYAALQWGLTGLALDPQFATNHFVYVYYTELRQKEPIIGVPVVVRFTDQNGRGAEQQVIVGDLPNTAVHHEGINANGRIHFGPDGFLYVSVGDYDAGETPFAQDLSSPIGKLLRVNKSDGSAAAGNPFIDKPGTDPRIYAYGFRVPFDFAFHPDTKTLYGTDNTPVTCEEINIIKPGTNYGWPTVGTFPWADCNAGEGTHGIGFLPKPDARPEDFLSVVSVSGLGFASARVYPTMGDSMVVCESLTSLLQRVTLAAPQFDRVTANDTVVKDCKLGLTISPDGLIYYSTDTEIRKLVPVPIESK